MLDLSLYPATTLSKDAISIDDIQALKEHIQKSQKHIIRICGFTGTGKGTLSSNLSKFLGLPNVESSFILRGATYSAIEQNLEIKPENIKDIYSQIQVKASQDKSIQIYYQGRLLFRNELKSPEVDALVATIAQYRDIYYSELSKFVQKLSSSVILDGRGTNTPYLDGFENSGMQIIRIFLDCSDQKRARRYMEAKNPDWENWTTEKKTEVFTEFEKGVIERDAKDLDIWIKQNIGIITPETGYLDTSELSIQEVLDTALSFIYKSVLG